MGRSLLSAIHQIICNRFGNQRANRAGLRDEVIRVVYSDGGAILSGWMAVLGGKKRDLAGDS